SFGVKAIELLVEFHKMLKNERFLELTVYTMSEDLVQSATHLIERYGYIRLGSTNLAQLRRSKYIRGKLSAADETRKPDGIV
ncbi:hypothetical protein ACPUD5_26050, partial [Escherichia coli]|uniref:hypothetical protein n=1 Tax=Escherichia coli TaxID=562 RepID=UPI003CC678D3